MLPSERDQMIEMVTAGITKNEVASYVISGLGMCSFASELHIVVVNATLLVHLEYVSFFSAI